MKNLKVIFFTALLAGLFYVLSMLFIRLHITQQAYAFNELKEFERSLKEEQRRLRLEMAELMSDEAIRLEGFEEPSPSQIARIP